METSIPPASGEVHDADVAPAEFFLPSVPPLPASAPHGGGSSAAAAASPLLVLTRPQVLDAFSYPRPAYLLLGMFVRLSFVDDPTMARVCRIVDLGPPSDAAVDASKKLALWDYKSQAVEWIPIANISSRPVEAREHAVLVQRVTAQGNVRLAAQQSFPYDHALTPLTRASLRKLVRMRELGDIRIPGIHVGHIVNLPATATRGDVHDAWGCVSAGAPAHRVILILRSWMRQDLHRAADAVSAGTELTVGAADAGGMAGRKRTAREAFSDAAPASTVQVHIPIHMAGSAANVVPCLSSDSRDIDDAGIGHGRGHLQERVVGEYHYALGVAELLSTPAYVEVDSSAPLLTALRGVEKLLNCDVRLQDLSAAVLQQIEAPEFTLPPAEDKTLTSLLWRAASSGWSNSSSGAPPRGSSAQLASLRAAVKAAMPPGGGIQRESSHVWLSSACQLFVLDLDALVISMCGGVSVGKTASTSAASAASPSQPYVQWNADARHKLQVLCEDAHTRGRLAWVTESQLSNFVQDAVFAAPAPRAVSADPLLPVFSAVTYTAAAEADAAAGGEDARTGCAATPARPDGVAVLRAAWHADPAFRAALTAAVGVRPDAQPFLLSECDVHPDELQGTSTGSAARTEEGVTTLTNRIVSTFPLAKTLSELLLFANGANGMWRTASSGRAAGSGSGSAWAAQSEADRDVAVNSFWKRGGFTEIDQRSLHDQMRNLARAVGVSQLPWPFAAPNMPVSTISTPACAFAFRQLTAAARASPAAAMFATRVPHILLHPSWSPFLFPHRAHAFNAVAFHGTSRPLATAIGREGFRRPMCRRLGVCMAGACDCQMEGFGVYFAEEEKARVFAGRRAEFDAERNAMVCGRIASVVDLGAVKLASPAICPCGCRKPFVDHWGYWYNMQGYDTLYVRDESSGAASCREWAVADPLRCNVVAVDVLIMGMGKA